MSQAMRPKTKPHRKVGCPVCGVHTKKWNVHHVVFKKLGGTNARENLLSICLACHAKAHNDDPAVAIPTNQICDGIQMAAHGAAYIWRSGRPGAPPIEAAMHEAGWGPEAFDTFIKFMGRHKVIAWRRVLEAEGAEAEAAAACLREAAPEFISAVTSSFLNQAIRETVALYPQEAG